MKESIYNITLHNHPQEGYKTIFSLLTNKFVCIEERIGETAQLPDAYIEKLKDMKILVSDIDEDKANAVNHFYHMTHLDTLNITILLTGKCNCQCVYCYESNYSIPELGDPLALARKIIDEASFRGVKHVSISFFGGEPLLNKKAIYAISETLYNVLNKNYSFAIVTNGILLSVEDIDRWTEIGLRSVKVTLDGDGYIHNRRRKTKNGNGTYSTILRNLEKISGHTKIIVNVVLDNGISSISGLLLDLQKHKIDATIDLSLCEPFSAPYEDLASLLVKYSKEIKDSPYTQHSALSHPHGAVCMMKDINNYTCAGAFVYGCNGNMSKALSNSREFTQKKPFTIPSQCMICKYLPICFGGCAITPECYFELYEHIVPALLRIYIGSK